MNKYVITITKDCSFEHIVTTLFKHGYVMGTPRLTDMESIKKTWPAYNNWRYVRIGTDKSCKRVVHSGRMDFGEPQVTLDEFLKMDL